jgi:hypothetical protein
LALGQRQLWDSGMKLGRGVQSKARVQWVGMQRMQSSTACRRPRHRAPEPRRAQLPWQPIGGNLHLRTLTSHRDLRAPLLHRVPCQRVPAAPDWARNREPSFDPASASETRGFRDPPGHTSAGFGATSSSSSTSLLLRLTAVLAPACAALGKDQVKGRPYRKHRPLPGWDERASRE